VGLALKLGGCYLADRNRPRADVGGFDGLRSRAPHSGHLKHSSCDPNNPPSTRLTFPPVAYAFVLTRNHIRLFSSVKTISYRYLLKPGTSVTNRNCGFISTARLSTHSPRLKLFERISESLKVNGFAHKVVHAGALAAFDLFFKHVGSESNDFCRRSMVPLLP